MCLSEEGRLDLVWWRNSLPSLKNWIRPPKIDETIQTDALDFAWGGIFDQNIGGSWSQSEIEYHINAKDVSNTFHFKKFWGKI